MPTNNKTNLGLNSWLGTDKPKRADFVEDNALIDTLLTGHFGDTSKHLSAQDRIRLEQGVAVGTYTGNGLANQEITLPFEATAVLVFLTRKPAYCYQKTGQYYENNFTIATAGDSMAGALLEKAILTVSQFTDTPAMGDTINNFNRSGSEYVYLAFR